MLSMRLLSGFAALFMLLACAGNSGPEVANSAPTAWTLDQQRSKLSFASVKNGSIVETHQFAVLSGTLLAEQTAKLEIDLASVQTGIPIRNERMREHLFKVPKFATATVTAPISMSDLDLVSMGRGESLQSSVSATVSMHGVELDLDVQFVLTVLADGSVQAISSSPLVVNAEQFGMLAGLEKLRELAGLNSISPNVPISFALTYSKESS